MPKILSAADIVAAKDLSHIDVEVPEWGGSVRLRTLDGDQFVQFVEASKGRVNTAQALKLIAMSLVDEEGNTLFKTEEDFAAFAKKNMQAILKLQDAAMKLNGIEVIKEKAEKNEAEVKNA